MSDFRVEDKTFIEQLQSEINDAVAEVELATPSEPYNEFVHIKGKHKGYYEAETRRRNIITHLRTNKSVSEACELEGITYYTYASYRQRYPQFAAKCDEARMLAQAGTGAGYDGSAASFVAEFFGHVPTWFQLMFINEMDSTPAGNILLVLWPPEFGKTTTFENHASRALAMDPTKRFLVASESRAIAQKILGRVLDRMDPYGPSPEYVDRFGPFAPQQGDGKVRQPWTDLKFRVRGARQNDERDYSMLAVGAGSKNIVSTRTDHAHVDDIQSTTTIGQTEKFVQWFRQDLLSRPGESGITTVCGTRVAEGDFYEALMDDDDLDSSIMKVIRFPAIITDHVTGEERSLWPEKWPLEKLERQKKKVGAEAWDRNYMQNPGVSSRGRGTFDKDIIEPCKDSDYSLQHYPSENSIVYIGVDPALGGKNCIIAVEATPDYRLIVRRIIEDVDFKTNSQIIDRLGQTIEFCSSNGAHVTDVVIEAMAFQKGLIHDENLLELRDYWGFSIRDHLTGWNKYDPDIGVPSMAESFRKQEIVLPYADDTYTRFEIDELCRQLYAWKPGVRGNRLRQDRVMALWFSWIMWRERWKKPVASSSFKRDGFKRSGLPYKTTKSGLLLPSLVRGINN